MPKLPFDRIKLIGIASGIGAAILGIVLASKYRAYKRKQLSTSLVSFSSQINNVKLKDLSL